MTSQAADGKSPGAAEIIRWSGLAAMVAGLIFAGIQPVHPPDVVASVTTPLWAAIIGLKLVMCLFMLVGIAGIYARQQARAGWLGFAGFVLFSLSWWLQTGFVFVEAFILPPLVGPAPDFVDSYLAIARGTAGAMDIGPVVSVYGLVGLFYLAGGLLLGIATWRAGVLPRWPAGLLALTALLTPAAALLPHEIQRLAAVPMGVALVRLGLALWSGRTTAAAGKRAERLAL